MKQKQENAQEQVDPIIMLFLDVDYPEEEDQGDVSQEEGKIVETGE